jgi:curli biogenesis system outer membrane secretion channel CsgG
MKTLYIIYVTAFILITICLSGCTTATSTVNPGFNRHGVRTVAVLCEVDGSGPLASGVHAIFENAMETSMQRKGFILVERERLQSVLNQIKIQSSDFFDRDRTQELGKLLGVDAIVLCKVEGLQYDRLMDGNYVNGALYVRAASLSARMIDLSTAGVLCRSEKSALYGILEAGSVGSDPLFIVRRPAALVSNSLTTTSL